MYVGRGLCVAIQQNRDARQKMSVELTHTQLRVQHLPSLHITMMKIVSRNPRTYPLRVQYSLSLYATITGIRWDYGREEGELAGVIGTDDKLRTFDLGVCVCVFACVCVCALTSTLTVQFQVPKPSNINLHCSH